MHYPKKKKKSTRLFRQAGTEKNFKSPIIPSPKNNECEHFVWCLSAQTSLFAIHSANIYWIPILCSARNHPTHILWNLLISSRNVHFSTLVNVFTVSFTMVFSRKSLLTYLIVIFLFQLSLALANIHVLSAKVLISISLCAYPIRLEGLLYILLSRYKTRYRIHI